MKKIILRVSEALLTLLCALGVCGGICVFATVNVFWFILIAVIAGGLYLTVLLLSDEVKYEGMTVDERHELLRNRGYRYCSYCGEKLEVEE